MRSKLKQLKSKHKTSRPLLLSVVLLLLVTPLALLAIWRMEGKAPSVEHDLVEPAIGKTPRAVNVDIQERGRGQSRS